MKRLILSHLILSICSATCFANSSSPQAFASVPKVPGEINEQARHLIRNQPVHFLENKGQMSDMDGKPIPFVLFKASASGMDMYVTEQGLTYVFIKAGEEEHEDESEDNNSKEKDEEESRKIEWNRVDMELKGASIRKENILKETPSITDFNYFYTHCPEGIYGVKKYEKITVKNIYPNIDWVLYNAEGNGFKYDFIVYPGADPAQIKLVYHSDQELKLNENGNIFIQTPLGTLTENAPVSYLRENRASVGSIFAKKIIDERSAEITFRLSDYSASETLVIDPQLVWGTLYGGNIADGAKAVDCDKNGNIYVTGYTTSADFPTQTSGSAYFNGTWNGISGQLFILKFSNTGLLIWGTYYGGTGGEEPYSIAADVLGNIYITGKTLSTDFPTQVWGSAYYDNTWGGGSTSASDVFIIRFSNAGIRDWATYYGSDGSDEGYSVTTDAAGNVYITGRAGSNFPTQFFAGAYYDNVIGGGSDAFVLRFSNIGVVEWATLYGGNNNDLGHGLTIDTAGNIYVTGSTSSTDFPTQAWGSAYFDGTLNGQDVFILRFSPAGVSDWATFYGGNSIDASPALACDTQGNIYVTGVTSSTDFPTKSWGGAYFDGVYGGASDIFVLRFSAAGNCDWATFYGGSGSDYRQLDDRNIVIDKNGSIYISFLTRSTDIQTFNGGCNSYYDSTYGASANMFYDAFLVQFSYAGQVLWATYVGGVGDDYRCAIAVDTNNVFYLCGEHYQYPSNIDIPLLNPGTPAYYVDDLSIVDPNSSSDFSYILKFIPCNQILSGTATSTNVLCNGQCTGTATANFSGGTAPYTYLWNTSPPQTSQSVTGLCLGTYTVTVTDYVNATLTASVSIAQPLALTTSLSVADASSCTSNDGSATANVSGGVSAYSYLWSNGGTASSITGIAQGTYTLTVTDANGCAQIDNATVGCPNGVSQLSAQSDFTISPNPTNGKFIVQMQGPKNNLQIEIYNMLGESIYQSSGNGGQFIVDISSQPGGIYFLKLVIEKKSVAQKIVIQK